MVGDRALLEQQYNYRIIIRIYKVETAVILNQQICDVTGVPLKEFKRRIARLRHITAAFVQEEYSFPVYIKEAVELLEHLH